jgi:hypothetical protein
MKDPTGLSIEPTISEDQSEEEKDKDKDKDKEEDKQHVIAGNSFIRGTALKSAAPWDEDSASSNTAPPVELTWFEYELPPVRTCMVQLWVEYATHEPRKTKIYRYLIPNDGQPEQHVEIGTIGTITTGGLSKFEEHFSNNVNFLQNYINVLRFEGNPNYGVIPHIRKIILRPSPLVLPTRRPKSTLE